MSPSKAKVRIGISGWSYPPWRGIFYPKGLVQRRELEFASRQVSSIEINGTFYSLQKADSFRKWAQETPEDFVFSIKGGRFITHILRLKDVEQALANFCASGILCLGHKLGPILWQFPPFLPWKDERFEEFLAKLPKTTRACAEMAKGHDAKVEGRQFTEALVDQPMRHAFEMRHASFANERFYDLLTSHNAGWVIGHGSKSWPKTEQVTADFAYYRMHGVGEEFTDGYSPEVLRQMAHKIHALCEAGTDVYVYFDNDAKAMAPKNALELIEILQRDTKVQPPEDPDDRPLSNPPSA